MAWIVFDFECQNCGTVWEDLVDNKDVQSPCPACETVSTTKLLTAPHLGTWGLKSNEERSAIMKRRSEEHTRKEVRKEAERWGDLGKERAREGQIRNNK